MSTALALYALLATAPKVVTPAGWEQVLQTTEPKGWISSVLAFGHDDWFVGGVWGVSKASAAGVQRTPTSPSAVLGLFGTKSDDVFAFGDDELVMRWDGTRWMGEHVGPKPKRKGRGSDILYSGFYDDSRVVAFGVSLVLIRRADGTWDLPPASTSKRLLDLAQLGPPVSLPGKCDVAGWFWLGKNRGMFDCHDGRSFIYEAGKVISKGRLPPECRIAFNAVTFGQGELYASCGSGKVWTTDREHWALFATFKGAKVGSISVTDRCVFVAGKRTVWRSCK